MGGSLFETKILGKKFFDDAYFRKVISARDFPIPTFAKIHFNFCCAGTIGFLQGHFLRRKFWGKNFFAMPTFMGSLLETDFLGENIFDKTLLLQGHFLR
jgi:hypothetical protein